MSVAYWENKRKEMVRDRKDELLSGRLVNEENYNPFNPTNMGEFLQEIGNDWVTRLCDLSVDAHSGTLWERDHKEQEVGMLFMSYAEQYWEERAEDKAEDEIPSADELDEDSNMEAAEAKEDR